MPSQRISGDYQQDGYALIEALLAPEMCNAFLHQFQHSMSLTLDYSDGVPWDLELECEDTEPSSRTEKDFGGAAHTALSMRPGDAVLYRGVHRRHGRTEPNPNGWSAHLFLHWVERSGPYADFAFDKNTETARPVNFSFR